MAVELRRGGLHLSGSALWLDASRKQALSFVSHAHADHIARHERTIATGPTLRLMAHRLGRLPGALPAPYRRPFDLGPLSLELLPAGHVLGSAQLRVIRADGLRVVYSGDINGVPSLTAEPLEVPECDVLVLESTFGKPRYVFPPKAQVLADIAQWAAEQLSRGVAPVLLGYPLGKSQEVIRYLQDQGFPICAHRSVCEVAAIYRELGVRLGPIRRFENDWREGEICLLPPRVLRRGEEAGPRPRATAMLTGWALDGLRFGADRAFPLSDHADYPGLLAFARATGAQEILTHHGFARELAQGLRRHGMNARPVGTVQQLELFKAA